MSVKILGIGTCLGNKMVSEKEVCETAGKEEGFLKVRTELTNVFYLEKNQGNIEDVFVDAILNALIDARLTVDNIDGIFVSNSGSHGNKLISLSAILATRLGLNKKKNIIAKDVNAACVGFGDALDTAFQQIKNDGMFNFKNYIVVAGDDLGSGQRDARDIKTGMFSDGVGCMIISNHPDASSSMQIKKTASGLSKGVNANNIYAISQPEGEKLGMNDGKELSSSLLNTADEIFSLLDIRRLENGTLIIPHQPNNKMIQKRENNSKIISEAKNKGLEIGVHNETYKTIGNVSGASVLFGLQKVLKEGLMPKGCKHIILAPFGAGGHLAGAEIQYKDDNKKIFGVFPKIWAEEYKKYSKIAYEANEKVFGVNAPISYKKSIAGRLIPNIMSEYSLDWFLPQKITINKLISSIDIFHWQVLKSIHTDKEFVTKNIYYEVPKPAEKDSPTTPTFYANNEEVGGVLKIDNIVRIGTTKSGKDIYRIVTLKDGVKIISEFSEIAPVHVKYMDKYKDISETQKTNIRTIASDDVNVHGSVGGYISSAILLEDKIPQSAIIDFIGGAKFGDKISIKKLSEVASDIKIPSKYMKEDNENILCIVNEDTKSLVATLTSNIKSYEDIKKENPRVYLHEIGMP